MTSPTDEELIAAVIGIDDDFMTSETHHPGYVLIPTAKFEAIRTALCDRLEGRGGGEAGKRPEGHCNDDAAWEEFRRQYAGKPRSRPDMTDFELANAVYMASPRNELDLLHLQTAAKERIRWLSIRLADALSREGQELVRPEPPSRGQAPHRAQAALGASGMMTPGNCKDGASHPTKEPSA